MRASKACIVVTVCILTVAARGQVSPQPERGNASQPDWAGQLIASIEVVGLEKLSGFAVDFPVHRGDRYDHDAMSYSLDQLQWRLADCGYIAAVFDDPVIAASDGGIGVTIRVTPGLPYRIASVKIREPSQMTSADLWRLIDFHSGMLAGATTVSKAIEAVHDACAQRGYAEAVLWVQVKKRPSTPDAIEGLVDYVLEVDEGRQYRLGTLSIEGMDVLKATELASVLSIRRGEIYVRNQLLSDLAQSQLGGQLPTGTISIDEEFDRQNAVANVTVRVLPINATSKPPN